MRECEETQVVCIQEESHDWISQLASRQSATCVKHAESWKVTTAGALLDKKYSLAWQLTRDSNSWLVLVARSSRQNAMFCWKIDFSHFISYPTINTLIPTKCNKLKRGAYWEKKNPKKSFYNTPTLLERKLLILREKSL